MSFLGFFDIDDAVSPVQSYGLITFRSRSSLGDGNMLRRLSNTSDSDTSDSFDTARRLGRPDDEALKAEVHNKARARALELGANAVVNYDIARAEAGCFILTGVAAAI